MGIFCLFSVQYIMKAFMTCLMLDLHATASAAFLALVSMGSRMAIRTAMIAITTSNSTRVNPCRSFLSLRIMRPLRLVRSVRWRPGIQRVVVVRIKCFPAFSVFEVSVAINHTATSQFRIILRLFGLIVTIRQQVVLIIEIVVRRPSAIVYGRTALIDNTD